MTSEDIRIDAQLLCGFQINDVTAFTWIKDAMKNIMRDHPLAASRKTIVVEITEAPETIELDEELILLERITRESSRTPMQLHRYEADEYGNITFYHNGAFEITYKYIPAMPQTKNDQLEMPDRYAEAMKYFVAARQRGRVYGQQDMEVQSYDAQFAQALVDADAALKRAIRRFKRMPARF